MASPPFHWTPHSQPALAMAKHAPKMHNLYLRLLFLQKSEKLSTALLAMLVTSLTLSTWTWPHSLLRSWSCKMIMFKKVPPFHLVFVDNFLRFVSILFETLEMGFQVLSHSIANRLRPKHQERIGSEENAFYMHTCT